MIFTTKRKDMLTSILNIVTKVIESKVKLVQVGLSLLSRDRLKSSSRRLLRSFIDNR